MTQDYQESKNNDVVEGLRSVLADTYTLYFKTHSFHWNVTGPNFKALHDLFAEQYTEMWQATDDLAERMRALDAKAPNSYSEMAKYASIQETGQTPDTNQMLKSLADDNKAMVTTLFKTLKTAEDAGDEATVDMMIARINTHEKYAWMLKSSAA